MRAGASAPVSNMEKLKVIKPFAFAHDGYRVVEYAAGDGCPDDAAEIAVTLGKGEAPTSNATLNNGLKDVPAFLLTPIPVDKDNIDSTIIADGFHKKSDVY